MSYTCKQLGKELQEELKKGYNIVRISRWAFNIFYNHTRELNFTQRNVLEELFRMEDDPQFEYTEQELRLLAELLINEEEDPIKKIDDMKYKGIS
jgi:hypothetical protein